jgi:hypothetical protein
MREGLTPHRRPRTGCPALHEVPHGATSRGYGRPRAQNALGRPVGHSEAEPGTTTPNPAPLAPSIMGRIARPSLVAQAVAPTVAAGLRCRLRWHVGGSGGDRDCQRVPVGRIVRYAQTDLRSGSADRDEELTSDPPEVGQGPGLRDPERRARSRRAGGRDSAGIPRMLYGPVGQVRSASRRTPSARHGEPVARREAAPFGTRYSTCSIDILEQVALPC